MSAPRDTLHDDIHGEVEDYELVLFERDEDPGRIQQEVIIKSPVLLDKLREQGWPTVYHPPGDTYNMDREFPRYGLSLQFQAKPNLKAKASGLPKDPVGAKLSRIWLKPNTNLRTGDSRIERIVLHLEHELAMAAP